MTWRWTFSASPSPTELLNVDMKMFNSNNMEMYLRRCWKIDIEQATARDLDFCVIRACKSNLMRQACELCKKTYMVKTIGIELACSLNVENIT